MNKFGIEKLRVAAESKAAEAASAAEQFGHENPKTEKAKGEARAASEAYREALL